MTKSDWLNPEQFESSSADSYNAHVGRMQALEKLEVNKCYSVPKQDETIVYEYELLKELADERSKLDNKRFVVIPHQQAYEVLRLKDNSSIKLFYKQLGRKVRKSVLVPFGECIDKVKELCKDYKEHKFNASTIDSKLTEEMIDDGIISHALIHRKLCNMAIFRSAKIGATEKIKEAIGTILNEGWLEQLDRQWSRMNYNTGAKLYRIKGYEQPGAGSDETT